MPLNTNDFVDVDRYPVAMLPQAVSNAAYCSFGVVKRVEGGYVRHHFQPVMEEALMDHISVWRIRLLVPIRVDIRLS